MDATTLTFLVVGGIGLALVLIALVVGEIGDFGHPDADGPFSLPAIASFVGAAVLAVDIGLARALAQMHGRLRGLALTDDRLQRQRRRRSRRWAPKASSTTS